jgi:GcrA cell cycle regulator
MFAIKQPWTAEIVELLKSRVDAGLSCRDIAREIGVTRNAVAGKISRLKLSRPKHVSGKHSEQKDNPKFRHSRVLKRYQILMALRTMQPPSAEELTIHNGLRCSLLELTQEKCRWPIGNPAAVDFWFCGNKAVEGLPYCVGHARIAYKPAFSRR